MPVFSLGGMRYQQSWDDLPLEDVEEENQRNLEAVVRRALELGVNHIETARGYGSSERQLGRILPTLPRDKIVVQTKIAPCADPELFRQHVHESLDRLGLEHIDLLGLHGINTYEAHWHSVRPGGCLEVARQLQAEGKVRHVGFSTHGSLPQILDTLRTDVNGGFDYVNLHWYYIFQNNWPAIEEATRRDIGVFIISPVNKGGMLNSPSDRLVELCGPLHPIVFNCLFCLARPQVHTLSLGAARPSDFDLQMRVPPLLEGAANTLTPIVARLDAAMADAVGPEVAQRYAEGLPDWQSAPGYMNFKTMLWLRNLALAYDLVEYGQMRYNLLGNGGHWFPGLSAAGLGAIPDEAFAKAVKNSPFADQVRGWLEQTHSLLGGAAVQRLSQS
ncbi:aldo/keto reductase [Pirellulimonas nuda]|nr:aldo/keto reductase [Pirellulimonas nuda]